MNNKNSTIEEIIQVIDNAENIVIAGHINPDADSVGSSLALANLIFKTGKISKVIMKEYNSKLKIIPGFDYVYEGDTKTLAPDLFICVDCGDIDRLGELVELFKSTENTIVIDHHISNNYFGKYNYVKAQVSSTCELVYEIAEKFTGLDKDIASCIYAGMLSDTGGFRYKSTSPYTLEIASKLLTYEIPFTEIYGELMYKKSMAEINAFKYALNNVKIVEDMKLAYTTITLEERMVSDISTKDLDGVSELIMRIRGIEMSVFAYEKEKNQTKISLRSKEKDVNKIALHFNGGGHKNASGCVCNESPDEAVKLIVAKIRSEFE